MKLIDIHNHLLYGVDDGVKSKEEMLELLKMAQADGIGQLIMTPHYKEEVYDNNKEKIKAREQEIKAIIKENGIAIDVYFGCEIYASSNSLTKLNKGELATLNDSKYVLIETHRLNLFQKSNFSDLLYNMAIDGYRPIIAHPERYEIVHNDFKIVYEWIKDNSLIQINAANLLNKKTPIYKIVKKLLDNRLVHFIASDAHDPKFRPLLLSEAYNIVKKQYGEDYANLLFYENPLKVIKNEEIDSDIATNKRSLRNLIYKG